MNDDDASVPSTIATTLAAVALIAFALWLAASPLATAADEVYKLGWRIVHLDPRASFCDRPFCMEDEASRTFKGGGCYCAAHRPATEADDRHLLKVRDPLLWLGRLLFCCLAELFYLLMIAIAIPLIGKLLQWPVLLPCCLAGAAPWSAFLLRVPTAKKLRWWETIDSALVFVAVLIVILTWCV